MNRSYVVFAVAAAVLVFATSPSYAEDAESCGSDPNFKAFDFWVGEWEVFGDDKKLGDNIISVEEGGCLLLERWTDVQGNTGQSYNYYNPDTKLWRQVWVSSYMIIDYAGGLTDDGSMELKGLVTFYHNQQSLPFLGRWTLREDGTVLQYFEQQDPESGEMVPVFSGIYRRVSSDDL